MCNAICGMNNCDIFNEKILIFLDFHAFKKFGEALYLDIFHGPTNTFYARKNRYTPLRLELLTGIMVTAWKS